MDVGHGHHLTSAWTLVSNQLAAALTTGHSVRYRVSAVSRHNESGIFAVLKTFIQRTVEITKNRTK